MLGKKVCVLEQHYTAGGLTHSYENSGYEWDVGVHYVGEVHNKRSPFHRLFDVITDGQLQWAPLDEVYDRVVIADRTYELRRGRDNLRARLKEYFPAEGKAIDRYIALVEKCALLAPAYFLGKLMPRLVATGHDRLRSLLLPREMMMSTREVLERLTRNTELIGLLTAQWVDYGTPPATSISLPGSRARRPS